MLRIEVPTPPALRPVPDVIVVPAGDTWLDVMTALGTVGAVIVALLLGVTEVNRYRRQEEERKRSALRGQAEAVTAWIEPGAAWPASLYVNYAAAEQRTDYGTVLNSSDRPIYDVAIITPDGHFKSLGFVPPGGRLTFFAPPVRESRPVQVGFTDAAGNHWQRDEEGAVKQVYDDPPF